MTKSIAVIRGDGIGPEIVTEALGVLNAVADRFGHSFTYMDVDMGGVAIDKYGEPRPQAELAKCLAADSGYGSVRGILGYQLHALFHLPEFPFLYAARSAILRHAGYDIFRASAEEQLKKASKPILMIHGEADTFVPFFMLQRIFDAAASKEKQMLAIPGAGHGTACCADPDRYWETYYAFADRYIV